MKSGSMSAYRAAADPEVWCGGTPDDEYDERPLPLRRWLDAIGAVNVDDWRLVEQPSAQYPQGRWEALVEMPTGSQEWLLAPEAVLP